MRTPANQTGARDSSSQARAMTLIENSWRRSARYGLRKFEIPGFDPIALTDLNIARQQHRDLMTHAAPVMETLYEQIVDTDSMIVLTDRTGLILHSLGDDSFLQAAEKVAMKPGVSWSEARRGTNAIGTAIAEGCPVLVHADQHFLHANAFLTCSASPIHAPTGELMGVLDVTGDYRGYHKHTMGLVRISATMIENALFRNHFRVHIVVALHTRPEFIGTLMEGLVALDRDGRVLSANAAASRAAGMSVVDMRSYNADSLLQVSIETLLNANASDQSAVMSAVLPNGTQATVIPTAQYARGTPPSVPRAPTGHPASPALAPARITLSRLRTGDPQIQTAVTRLESIAHTNTNVILEGEIGVGKEHFARALHLSGLRAAFPFTVLHGSTLGESALVHAAGTVFLHDICELDFGMQARVLSWLHGQAANMQVVCGSRHNLRSLTLEGRLREDLYYRLNGLTVRIPSVRERSDFDSLIASITSAQITSQARSLLRAHTWPGNVRELTNVLQTAHALAGSSPITTTHLPETFLNDIRRHRAIPQPPEKTDLTKASLADLERDAIARTLAQCDGNITAACRILGISRNTFYRRMKAETRASL